MTDQELEQRNKTCEPKIITYIDQIWNIGHTSGYVSGRLAGISEVLKIVQSGLPDYAFKWLSKEINSYLNDPKRGKL